MAAPSISFLLARCADDAWRAAIRPWLQAGHGRLQRSYVVVPTRGQAQGLKQRCAVEAIPFLGVEFLSPGLARKKWLPLVAARPVLGRELLLVELQIAIARRLAATPADDPKRGIWKSLQSDAERALDNWDELLKAGFRTPDFPLAPLAEIFGEVAARIDELGYELGATQSERAALTPLADDAIRVGGRLLVYGFGAEMWGEFFNVAALARRFDDLTVVLPEPEFRGRKMLDEAWVELWQAFLGVPALPLSSDETTASCDAVAALWRADDFTGRAREPGDALAGCVEVIVGETRSDEIALVAGRIGELVEDGATDVAVVFPRADAWHLRLARLLEERGIRFVDLLESAGPPPLEVRLQRALIAFYERGARLEELLQLWPMLQALGLARIGLGAARDVCTRLFDERQTHALSAYREKLGASERAEWREVNRVAELLLPPWPDELTLADGLARFEAVCARLAVGMPESWPALGVFASRETRLLAAREVFAAIASFLPDASPAQSRGPGGFARVTLTTRRRAEGLAWSHAIFVEANAGVWPERRDPGSWLTDNHRLELNARSRFSLGLFTGDDRAALEKNGYATIARDCRERVIFSAALFDDTEPELKLAPNSWLERVLWAMPPRAPGGGHEYFERLARKVPAAAVVRDDVEAWAMIWTGRRDAERPFDDFFLSADPQRVAPKRLSPRLIEQAVQDPAALWFESVLGAGRVDWRPFVRARKRALGQLVHRVLATAVRGAPVEEGFFEKAAAEEAAGKLAAGLRRLRELWPSDRYWDSFHAELVQVARRLLENLFSIETGRYVATEQWLPEGATVSWNGRERLVVRGRMDAVFLDRPGWAGASVDIVDFKTGGDAKLSAARMARDGSSLQLGIYLGAVQSLGARDGRVWMVKPEAEGTAALSFGELDVALVQLGGIARHLATGKYGALTPDRSAYAPEGVAWPVACVPVPEAILRKKFEVTFGAVAPEDGDE